ncbi:Diaminopimelate epimerase-like protein [Exidia glandulosa HHB12029]|uniref:Diaminopimelate epimerase-like protein n=1 Tax=Exidia glandulosa HHB12029 TaxID=1314781 RepID=A0A165G8T5_EXIGL|nr:Diaminopimelate epimerase-like protein [Exidia glandulosa HHB12029]
MAPFELSYTIVDAFTGHVFAGNPAAVIVLPKDHTLPDATLQLIAREFNLSETAFLSPTDESDVFGLRWFTPALEVPLCGHATLASAHVLLTTVAAESKRIVFKTRWSGELIASRADNGKIELEFPAGVCEPESDELKTKAGETLKKALALDVAPVIHFVGGAPGPSFQGYLLIHVDDSIDLANLKVDSSILTAELNPPYWLQILTNTPQGEHHFVSRVFATGSGVPEDPVTGSAHCMLATYWTQKLGISGELRARQVSQRGGNVDVEWVRESERVKIRGEAVVAAKGILLVPL